MGFVFGSWILISCNTFFFQTASAPKNEDFCDLDSKLEQPEEKEEASTEYSFEPSLDRSRFFQGLQQQIQQAESFEHLQNIARQHEKEINKYKIVARDLLAGNFDIDNITVGLYPKDGPALLPIKIYGDGNCLARCGSLLAFGKQDHHTEIRARINCELALHEDLYLSDDFLQIGHDVATPAKFYAQYCVSYAFEELTDLTIKRLFENEIMHVRPLGESVGAWHVHALSSVLGTPIQAIYPIYGGYTVRPHLHRLIFPREKADIVPAFVPGIMWTHTEGKNKPPISWNPNHFVVCLPGPGNDQNSHSTMPPFTGILFRLSFDVTHDARNILICVYICRCVCFEYRCVGCSFYAT